MKRTAISSAGLQPNDQARIQKGTFLLVRSDGQQAAEKVMVCFILWHEFGHALADNGVGSNANEKSACAFELEAIADAKQRGELPSGCTDEMIRAFLDVRRSANYGDDQNLIRLANTLERALSARPARLCDDNYMKMAMLTTVNERAEFDSSKFVLAIKNCWPLWESFDAAEKKKIKDYTRLNWPPPPRYRN